MKRKGREMRATGVSHAVSDGLLAGFAAANNEIHSEISDLFETKSVDLSKI